jgi:hypothetical protein
MCCEYMVYVNCIYIPPPFYFIFYSVFLLRSVLIDEGGRKHKMVQLKNLVITKIKLIRSTRDLMT